MFSNFDILLFFVYVQIFVETCSTGGKWYCFYKLIEGLRAEPTQMTFQIDFCCFSSNSPEVLHVALNSFRKRFICCFAHCLQLTSMIMGKISVFITKQSAKQEIQKSDLKSHLGQLCSQLVNYLLYPY